VISIIEFPTLQSSEEETVDHIPKEKCFLGFGALGHRNMWQHFLLQNLLGVAQSFLFVETCGSSAGADKVKRVLQVNTHK
jgi:hypothetical protein